MAERRTDGWFGAGSLFVYYHHTSVILGIFSLLHPVLSIYHPVLAVQVLEFHAHHLPNTYI